MVTAIDWQVLQEVGGSHGNRKVSKGWWKWGKFVLWSKYAGFDLFIYFWTVEWNRTNIKFAQGPS